jgi:hypothetical protein
LTLKANRRTGNQNRRNQPDSFAVSILPPHFPRKNSGQAKIDFANGAIGIIN